MQGWYDKMNIIYIRTSSEDQNPENQLKDCLRLCNGEYTLFKDKQTAFKDNVQREQFNKAIKLIKSNKVKDFYVWDLDRIYRNRKRLKEFFELCKIYNCNIHSYNQQWLEELLKIPEPFNDIMYDLMLNLMGWLAEDESKKKSDRVKIAIRKKNGVTRSYKGNKWGRKAINKKVIDEILEKHKKGKKLREITEEVTYWDKNNNKKNVSLGFVHKVINFHKMTPKSKEVKFS